MLRDEVYKTTVYSGPDSRSPDRNPTSSHSELKMFSYRRSEKFGSLIERSPSAQHEFTGAEPNSLFPLTHGLLDGDPVIVC